MKRSSSWISLCGVLAALCAVQATYTHFSTARCDCRGRSQYCLRDAVGLHCVDCQGNTEGRHCERCKDGFYLKGAGPDCSPCRCNSTGSVGASCDSRGRCSCKDGVTGDKCNRCPDGPIGPTGCSQRRRLREDSGSLTSPCFCYGHSSSCAESSDYSVHDITSTFSDGTDGWKTATAQGVAPDDVHFRWSPKHQDLEVISANSLPVYLYAPARYLGNQLLSYGQNLSFSLRLDRGVRHPSTSDVVLEGGGLRVAASLGELRSVVPCGQKINYSFRLDEQPASRWRPQISSSSFQKLLQNLTAVKIRATFGQNGRGYLDNVKLVSAELGPGVPARWVRSCFCPLGYEGVFCERCAAGFRRRGDGPFGGCERCGCRGGGCDPLTGDCYSADQTTGPEPGCPHGFYRDPRQQHTCVSCPCPGGVACSLAAGALQPRCELCPPGTTGSRCDVCQEGFYGDPSGTGGVQRPCRPCRCNGHIDAAVAGSCDRSSGACLKCLNNTAGRRCDACVPGFYRSRAADACKPCDCDVQGSESTQCDDSGRCRCRPGFEGLRCQRSNCPSCFSPIKAKMGVYAGKLKELERLFSGADGGLRPTGGADMEAALGAVEELVDDLQDATKQLKALEKRLQGRLASISRSQLSGGQDLQNMADTAADVGRQQQTYKTTVEDVQDLIQEMKRKLAEAKTDLRSAEVPVGDAPLEPNFLSSLVQKATGLADRHQTKADAVEKSANDALSDSKKSLSLVRNLMTRENNVKELIGDLKSMYDQTSAQVKTLENQATQLSDEARAESKMADGMLKDISSMERGIPPALKAGVEDMVSRLGGFRGKVDGDISDFEATREDVQRGMAAAEGLLSKGRAAQQEFDGLRSRVDAAKAETDGALRSINSNANELEDALSSLRGFDQQIDSSKALAAAAIGRLPGIKATIQQAVGQNGEMQAALGDVSDHYNAALGTNAVLQNLVTGLEGAFGSLPSFGNLGNEAAKLNADAADLKAKAAAAAGEVSTGLDGAMKLEANAKQAADGATAAFNFARQTRTAVGKTLKDISSLLANMNQPGVVDEERLKQLEDSLAGAQRDVEQRLRPRLADMEEKEAAQRRRLTGINTDIDGILVDIANLEDILRTVPGGCFNSPPIEEA